MPGGSRCIATLRAMQIQRGGGEAGSQSSRSGPFLQLRLWHAIREWIKAMCERSYSTALPLTKFIALVQCALERFELTI